MELKRAPGTCCPEPGCDNHNCLGCEYLTVCKDDPQRIDYCPRPRTCPSCGASCLTCPLWQEPTVWKEKRRPRVDFSKMTEGQALYSIGVRATEKDGKSGILLPHPDKTGKPLFIPASSAHLVFLAPLTLFSLCSLATTASGFSSEAGMKSGFPVLSGCGKRIPFFPSFSTALTPSE